MALREQAPMWSDAGVTLAIETHFEFTSHELRRLIERCEAPPGGWLGICLDTMNLLTMIEHPIWAAERLLPWVVSTHIKTAPSSGRTTSRSAAGRRGRHQPGDCPPGPSLERPVHLSVEDHGGGFRCPFDPTFLSFPETWCRNSRASQRWRTNRARAACGPSRGLAAVAKRA
jgi:hypothetical protein